MRCSRTWVAVLAVALALLASGCPRVCESSERAPVPEGITPRFAVLARDQTRTQISLLDASGARIQWPTPDPDDAAEALTDVWFDANLTWEDQLATVGIGLDGRMPWTPLPGGGVTIAVARFGRELVRFPFDAAPPQEIRTAPALVSRPDATGAVVIDLVVVPASSTADPDDRDTLYALRSPGIDEDVELGQDLLVIELDPMLDVGGSVVDRIPLATLTPGAPAHPERMVYQFARLYIGLDGYAPATSPEESEQVAPGTLAIVDPAGRRVVGTFQYEATERELTRCAEVAPSLDPTGSDDVARLVVACRGTGADLAERASHAGVVELLVQRDSEHPDREPVVTIENVWSSVMERAALPSRGLVPLPGRAAAFVSAGDVDEPRDDVLYVVDLDAQPVRAFRVATAPLLPDELSGMGTGAYLPESAESGLLVWPLGRRGVLRRRIRTVPSADGNGRDVVVCPGQPGCSADDAALENPVELCNHLLVEQVRLLTP